MERRSFFGRILAGVGLSVLTAQSDACISEERTAHESKDMTEPKIMYSREHHERLRQCPRCGNVVGSVRDYPIFRQYDAAPERGRICNACNIWWGVPEPTEIDWDEEKRRDLKGFSG